MPTIISYELNRLRLIKSVFFLNPSYRKQPPSKPAGNPVSLDNRGDFDDSGLVVIFVQSFHTEPGEVRLPFSLDVEFEALFAFSAPPPPEERENLVQRMFSKIVFPFTREYVAEVTRRAGFPPMLLNADYAGDETEVWPNMPTVTN
jgi:preprotein translocase subunit SecB